MKKLSVLLIAGLMVLALTMPAAAFENQFGGYWRTRFYTDIGFSGSDIARGNQDVNAADTRTRLYYTAKFSENLSFVNKFEVNATWGANKGYGEVGADAVGDTNYFRVKNSYVDFKLGEQRFKVGVMGMTLGRGYILDDDISGIQAIFKVNDAIYLPLIYVKPSEGGTGKINGVSASDYDISGYVFYPTIYLNKENTLKPHVAYITTENGSLAQAKNSSFFNDAYNPTSSNYNPSAALPGVTKIDLWSAGLEYDGKIGIFDLGATGIFQFGDATVPQKLYGTDKTNFRGMLFDAFGGVNLGPANVHLKGIYSSGQKHTDSYDDINAFVTIGPKDSWGSSYYWAEIMGEGLIDNQQPIGAPGDKISNVWIGNLGASYKLLADLKFSADLWYAKHAEDVAIATPVGFPTRYSSDLGTEVDLVASYTIVDNLKIDLIGAYLWAGDCITKSVDPNGTQNPIELATMLSLAF